MSTENVSRVVLVTGAAGAVGQLLLSAPPRAGRRYVTLDPEPVPGVDGRADVTALAGSVTDHDAVARAMAGVTDVVHLGAVSVEDEWQAIVDVNLTGTKVLLQAAADSGVGRFVFASSNHAVGFYTPRDAGGAPLADDVPARPDTFYGWSKAAGELLVKLYTERYDMSGVVVRIGHCFSEPLTGPRLPVWLSPRDLRGLIDAALDRPIERFQTVWGASANTRSWLSLDGARQLGYEPTDDSEIFAERFPDSPAAVSSDEPIGAHFVSVPLGEPMRTR